MSYTSNTSALTVYEPPLDGEIIDPSIDLHHQPPTNFWQYFGFGRAVRAFLTDFHAARGAATFAELRKANHTYRQYRDNLKRFMRWLKTRQIDGITPFPDEGVIRDYVRYLRLPNGLHSAPDGKLYRDPLRLIRAEHHPKGHVLSSASVNTYLAPVRVFLRHLRPVRLPVTRDPLEALRLLQVQNDITFAVGALQAAANYKGLPPDKVVESALYAFGKRLSQESLDAILQTLKVNDSLPELRRKREYAVWLTFVFSGLRISSVARITRNSIEQSKDNTYTINLLHKGSKQAEVSVDEIVVWAIDDWIQAFNKAVGNDPQRIIKPSDTVWRNLTPRKHRPYDELASCTHASETGALRDVIKTYSTLAGYPVKPHDLRRTLAKIATDLGMNIVDLSRQLCHASIDQTAHYVGPDRNFAARNITNLDGFWLAASLKS